MENVKKKNGFASGIGFILAAAGSAVGLGNLWGFPRKVSANGGAAFVFVYIACVLFIGAIAMVAEIYIGKRAQANTVTSYKKINKNLGWMGIICILVPFIIICYYCVLGGYTVKYSLNSFNDGGNSGILGSFSANIGEVILYSAIFVVLTLVVVMAGVKNGIEKASKVLMPTLFIILIAIVIYCFTLSNAKEGLKFYLKPDFSALTFDAVLAAMGQAFFSLSLGMGAMICYGSYTGSEIKIGKSVTMICLFDTLVALLAGLAIFPAYGSINPGFTQNAKAIESLQGSGLVLMFAVIPAVFSSMGKIGAIVSFFFFAMVAIAALTSLISLVEVVTQFLVQKTKITRKKGALIICAICFAISIPTGISLGHYAINEWSDGINLFGFDLLTFFDETTNCVLMPLCAFAACVAIGWIFGEKKSLKDWFNPNTTAQLLKEDGLDIGFFGKIFAVMVKFVTPVLIAAVEIGGVIGQFKKYGINYLAIVIFALILIVCSIIVYFAFLKNTYTGENVDELNK